MWRNWPKPTNSQTMSEENTNQATETPVEEVHQGDALMQALIEKNRQKAPEDIEFEDMPGGGNEDVNEESYEDFQPGEGGFTDDFGENQNARVDFFVETIWQTWKFIFEAGVPWLHTKQVYNRIDPAIIQSINRKGGKMREVGKNYQNISSNDFTFEEAEALERVQELDEWKQTVPFKEKEGKDWKAALRRWAIAEGWNIQLPPWFQFAVVTGTMSISRMLPMINYLASPPEKLVAPKKKTDKK